MRSIFSEFSNLWPESGRAALKPLLDKIPFFFYPAEKMKLEFVKNPQECIVIFEQGQVRDIIGLTALGFEHCVQQGRPDFPQELLASALMVSRPEAFAKNPVPFFFTGFSPQPLENMEINMSIPFQKTSEKSMLLEKLSTFLDQNPRLQGIADLCIQAADELVSNALYSAPIDNKGMHLNQNVDRTQEVILPADHKARLFACFSDYRVVVGCEDLYGSFRKNYLIDHLENLFLKDKSTARLNTSAGAGLGFRYMIENSANFYLYCDQGKRSLVATSFLLQGLKSNLTAQKHFHISFR